jgi:hypothetical protein
VLRTYSNWDPHRFYGAWQGEWVRATIGETFFICVYILEMFSRIKFKFIWNIFDIRRFNLKLKKSLPTNTPSKLLVGVHQTKLFFNDDLRCIIHFIWGENTNLPQTNWQTLSHTLIASDWSEQDSNQCWQGVRDLVVWDRYPYHSATEDKNHCILKKG